MRTTEVLVADRSSSPATATAWKYVGLAFGFSWITWLLVIKVAQGREYLLNLGAAGPALAALVLSRRGEQSSPHAGIKRMTQFFAWFAISWLVLTLYYSWRSNPHLHLTLNPWLTVPAAVPAWILSGVQSRDLGVRSLLERMVHSPGRWSAIALLFFPSLLLVPASIAHLLRLPLVTPERQAHFYSLLASDAVFFLFNVLFVATLEEPGWRGFLLDNLQTKYSPLLASIMVWFAWALWHAPLDYFRPVRFSLSTYLQVRVVFLIPVTIILTWLYNRSVRSIQSTMVFHASMNTFPFILPYYPPSLGLLFVLAAYFVVSERMWRSNVNSGLART